MTCACGRIKQDTYVDDVWDCYYYYRGGCYGLGYVLCLFFCELEEAGVSQIPKYGVHIT